MGKVKTLTGTCAATVINPCIVLRVGYPFDHRARAQEILASWPYKHKYGALTRVGGLVQTPFGDVLPRTAKEIANSLAVDEAKKCGWGGNHREVFLSPPIESLRDMRVQVYSKRTVVEGDRVEGQSSRDFYGDGGDDGFSTYFVFGQRITLYTCAHLDVRLPDEVLAYFPGEEEVGYVEIPSTFLRFDEVKP